MLGICFMEKGMPKLAIKWFEKGLKTAAGARRSTRACATTSRRHTRPRATSTRRSGFFTELYGQDANFRDVAAKLRELRALRPDAGLAILLSVVSS
jgi:hypothetical protein